MNKTKNKIISLILTFSLILSFGFLGNIPKAQAIYPTSATFANLIPDIGSFVTNIGDFAWNLGEYALDNVQGITLAGSKIAAMWAVNRITQAIIGDGGGGGVVTDWNAYLFTSPQQQALTQMNSFFNTISRGKLSSANYEGIGNKTNYAAYLATESKKGFKGQAIATTLPGIIDNPSQVFDGGNTKAFMQYMECGNNISCLSVVSANKYQSEVTKIQTTNEKKQKDGFLPVIKNGKITQPAAMVSAAFNQMDKMGVDMIMNANMDDGLGSGLMQVAAGAAVSTAAKSLNYATASSKGKAAIKNETSKFPFSVSYSKTEGATFSTKGRKINAGTTYLAPDP